MSIIMESMGKKPVRRRRSFTSEFKAEIANVAGGVTVRSVRSPATSI
jgi:hypothetical protein